MVKSRPSSGLDSSGPTGHFLLTTHGFMATYHNPWPMLLSCCYFLDLGMLISTTKSIKKWASQARCPSPVALCSANLLELATGQKTTRLKHPNHDDFEI